MTHKRYCLDLSSWTLLTVWLYRFFTVDQTNTLNVLEQSSALQRHLVIGVMLGVAILIQFGSFASLKQFCGHVLRLDFGLVYWGF